MVLAGDLRCNILGQPMTGLTASRLAMETPKQRWARGLKRFDKGASCSVRGVLLSQQWSQHHIACREDGRTDMVLDQNAVHVYCIGPLSEIHMPCGYYPVNLSGQPLIPSDKLDRLWYTWYSYSSTLTSCFLVYTFNTCAQPVWGLSIWNIRLPPKELTFNLGDNFFCEVSCPESDILD